MGSKRHAGSQPTVTLLQRIVPHYRVAFLERLAARLDQAGIRLIVIHGQERPGSVPHGEHIDAPWAQNVSNIYAGVGSLEFVWQRGFRKCLNSDLIVIEQANRLLVNYLLQLKRGHSHFRLAYWGHGRNLQARDQDSLAERIKRKLATRADWWFAYTEMSKEHVIDCGFPEARVTVVNNAIADCELIQGLRDCENMSARELALQLGCCGEHIGLYCGSLHKEKRLEFLFDAAVRIRVGVPDFELLVIGDGPQAPYVRAIAARHSWIRYVGPVMDSARAKYFRAARIVLMPGLVGLVVVDSFVTACPIFTTAYPYHSPEIAYLEPGNNGVMTLDDLDSYVGSVVTHLTNESLLNKLRHGCRVSAEKYSLESMVERFAEGVEHCLSADRYYRSGEARSAIESA